MDFFRRKVSIFSDGPKKNMAQVKKTAKRARPKKSAAKKTILIIDAAPESYFWVNNGNILKNLHDLQDALVLMNEEQFDFHTKRDGNDFAKWVEDVFGEKELAKRIAKAKNKKATMVALAKYIG